MSAPIIGKRKVPVGELPRVPAQAIEDLIRDRIATIMNIKDHTTADHELAQRILKKVTVYKDNIELEINHAIPNADTNRLKDNNDTITQVDKHTHIRIPAILQKRNLKLALVNPNGSALTKINNPDLSLIKNIVLANQLKTGHENGTYKSLQQMANIHKCTISYARRILLLAYLAPDITKSILEGSQPASVTLTKLTTQKLPIAWNEQRQFLGYVNA